jgi:conjugal transfer pilus assembly protein TraE
MDLKKAEKDRLLFAQRAVALGVVCGLSVLTNAILAAVVMNNQKVVLVPTLPAAYTVDGNGRVDPAYLEALARDCVYLFLNKTPETANYFIKEAQAVMDPTAFEGMKLQLQRDSAESESLHQSQTFFPEDFYENAPRLYAEVRGHLKIVQGDKIVDDQYKIYGLQFSKIGTLVRLVSIKEIDPKASEGEKLKPGSEPSGAK